MNLIEKEEFSNSNIVDLFPEKEPERTPTLTQNLLLTPVVKPSEPIPPKRVAIYRLLNIDTEPPYKVTVGNRFSQFTVSLKELVEDPVELEKFDRLVDVKTLCTRYGAIHGDIKTKGFDFNSHINPAPKTGISQTLTIVYCAVFVLSNLSAAKLSSVYGIAIDAGTAFFPISLMIDDILTEVYGLKTSRRAIWYAIMVNAIVALGLYLVTFFPVSSLREEAQPAFELLYNLAPKIFFASIISFLIEEFLNSFLLARSKALRRDRNLSMRLIKSTIAGNIIGSFIFCFVSEFDFRSASLHIPTKSFLETVGLLICTNVLYELLLLYPVCKVIQYVKKIDGIDYVDPMNYKFWPFNLFKKPGGSLI